MAIKAVGTLISSLLLVQWSLAFPNGGPIDACVKQRANQPNHSGILPQSVSSNPFIIEASSNYYRAGDVITVTILGPEKSFKGFFFQARDGKSDEWIGTFEKGPESKSYPECSATTHINNEPKTKVALVWHAPADRSGDVFFVGTVLQDYKTFWSDVVADVRQ